MIALVGAWKNVLLQFIVKLLYLVALHFEGVQTYPDFL